MSKSRVLHISGWPERGNSDVALHAIALTLNSREPKKRGAHRNKGSHGRWSASALRSLFVDVLLLQIDKRCFRIGEKAKGPTEALRFLATVERASWELRKPKATESRDPKGWRVLHSPRADARAMITLLTVS